ncbi:MAG: alpha/beta hydrolase [Hydrocarboniphaga sp.]|uniref:alpha/beta fold hydrolase n=1 Tax=Hydrocarboniphaga sp. TaxID=2033016 RepID=UPI00262167CB|nr:alpha/beta hydrolase [Hydrocarboniphaga sp.]MDB5967768.1 alpha/beta hydrolase [Hydrocarboniphaga sp.]
MNAISRSEFVQLRGLRYHVRRWGRADAPALFLLHGWLDVSASFHDLVQPLLPDWQVLAPDWRGFGLSEWPQDGYWFADYLGDLEALLDHYAPGVAVRLIGHSLGAQIASIYAGLRPARVERLALLDGLFMPDQPAALAPKKQRQWLDELREPPRDQHYASYEELAERIRRLHPRLSAERALSVAQGWGYARPDGRIGLCADPRHRRVFPTLYRAAESRAVWSEVTARTLFIDAGKSELHRMISAQERAERLACFRERQEAVIEDCGHMLHFEAPAETAWLLRPFFAA